MSNSYQGLSFSSVHLAGAVAEAVLHDLRVNHLAIRGFPQIDVETNGPISTFYVMLSWNSTVVKFEISRAEAKSATDDFKKKKQFSPELFKHVQKALAHLESIAD